MRSLIIFLLVCWVGMTNAFSQGAADTIAFYNAKYNSTCLLSMKQYTAEFSKMFAKDTAILNSGSEYIRTQMKEIKRTGDYLYLSPNYFVNVRDYSAQKHLVKMNNVMYTIITQQKFKLFLNGKVYTMANLTMETADLHCRDKRCGKKWILRTKDTGTIVFEGVRKIKRSALLSGETGTKL